MNPIIKRPFLATEDIWPPEDAVKGAAYLISAAGELKNNDTYRFDIVNPFWELPGHYQPTALTQKLQQP